MTDGDAEDSAQEKKNEFMFCHRISKYNFPDLLSASICLTLAQPQAKYCMKQQPSPKEAKLSPIKLQFCRGRQGNVQKLFTHVHDHCSPH